MNKIKSCPFCNSNKIGYSIKTCGSYRGQYHVAMYCKDCNCYGKRTLIKPTETARWEIENNESYKELAIAAWNTRETIDEILGFIKFKINMLEQELLTNPTNIDNLNEVIRNSNNIVRIDELKRVFDLIKESESQ